MDYYIPKPMLQAKTVSRGKHTMSNTFITKQEEKK